MHIIYLEDSADLIRPSVYQKSSPEKFHYQNWHLCSDFISITSIFAYISPQRTMESVASRMKSKSGQMSLSHFNNNLLNNEKHERFCLQVLHYGSYFDFQRKKYKSKSMQRYLLEYWVTLDIVTVCLVFRRTTEP